MSQSSVEVRASAASIYDQIRAKILRNEIAPGTRINIDAISRDLGVSPTPVREALRQLQGATLVVQDEGRGYRTTPLLNASELRELFEFRLLIEPWAARMAAGDRLSNPGHILDQQLVDLEKLQERQGDVRFNLIEHDTDFHEAVLGSIDNRVVLNAFTQAHPHLHAFRLHPTDYSGDFTVSEHRAIADNIRNRDAKGAEEAMRAHVTNAYLRFAEGLSSDADTPKSGNARPAQDTRLAI